MSQKVNQISISNRTAESTDNYYFNCTVLSIHHLFPAYNCTDSTTLGDGKWTKKVLAKSFWPRKLTILRVLISALSHVILCVSVTRKK